MNVRFAPESGRIADISVCPLCANSDLTRRSKKCYSITSSARACRLKSQGRQGMTGNGTPHAFKQADPCSLVVFGASGDLMHRLLFPALYNLAAGSLLPDAFALIGVGRSEMSDDALREDLRKSLQQFATRPVEEKLAHRVVGGATYVRGDVNDPVSYDRLRQALQRIEAERGTKGNRLFYMATPPSAFRPIACQLGRSRLACEENGSWRRIIIEKPFGTDLASARKLNHDLLGVFDEDQLYRIDHYLGTETGQDLRD